MESVMVAGGISMGESVLTMLHNDRSRRRIHRHFEEHSYIFDEVFVRRTYFPGRRSRLSWQHLLREKSQQSVILLHKDVMKERVYLSKAELRYSDASTIIIGR